MAVEDVKVPKRLITLDPTGKNKKEVDSSDYWEKQARTARAQREYLEEKTFADKIANPPDPPEAPFQIKGSVNLGDIDLTEQQRKTEESNALARKEARERIDKAEQERDEARQLAHNAQLALIQDQLTGKIERLQEAINSNSRVDIATQLQSIEKLAGMLGYQKIEAGPTDSSLVLEIKRLEQQMARDEREFQQRMKEDERNWTIKLRELDQRAKEADARLKHEQDKWNALVSVPERIGAAVAQGFMEKSMNGVMPTEAPIPQPTVASNGKQTYHAEANVGETGEINCPECQTLIGISPVAKKVECINCGTKVVIKRIPITTERENNVGVA